LEEKCKITFFGDQLLERIDVSGKGLIDNRPLLPNTTTTTRKRDLWLLNELQEQSDQSNSTWQTRQVIIVTALPLQHLLLPSLLPWALVTLPSKSLGFICSSIPTGS
jgi:hypothetical protein